MLCNNAEHKKMGQDPSLGQLYDVHNERKIYTKHWLGLFIYYGTDMILIPLCYATYMFNKPASEASERVKTSTFLVNKTFFFLSA
jgi:hypothetical protein